MAAISGVVTLPDDAEVRYGAVAEQHDVGVQQYGAGVQQYGAGAQQYGAAGGQQHGAGAQQYGVEVQHGAEVQLRGAEVQLRGAGAQQYGAVVPEYDAEDLQGGVEVQEHADQDDVPGYQGRGMDSQSLEHNTGAGRDLAGIGGKHRETGVSAA